MAFENDLTAAFCQAFRMHPAGVVVISAMTEDGPQALTVSSLISISAKPPVVAFSLSGHSARSAAILTAETAVLHFLKPADQQLAQVCATPGANRFDGAHPWEILETGEPRFTAVATWFRARLDRRMPLEAATLVVATLQNGTVPPSDLSAGEAVLVYVDRGWHEVASDHVQVLKEPTR
ncbi:MAG: flavin reductase family protein [Pararhodobacter sp.]|nr:flavin reductase family protein [Pararhodobacter sp.]